MIRAPAGRLTLTDDFLVEDQGDPDAFVPQAQQLALEDLPVEVLIYLLGSRYCETDRLSNIAWSLFRANSEGLDAGEGDLRLCSRSHHVQLSRREPDQDRVRRLRRTRGVCRDYAHLAIALCRCMNVPARYCTGYLGDIGVPPDDAAMDFRAWYEVYLGDRWYTFDPRHNMPRLGRILMARGRDATDVAIVTSFGPCTP